MSKLKIYQTVHGISKIICQAFHEGIPDSQLVPAVTLLDGDMACYGILRGTHELINECKELGRTWWYVDHGYFKRSDHNHGKFDGYYRVTKSNYQYSGLGEYPSDRWEALDVQLEPWRRHGDHILVCPMSYNMAVHTGVDHRKWMKDTIAEISKHTDRTILIKPKSSDMLLDEALTDCHAIVGFDTNALIDSVVAGVPSFNLGNSAVAPVALQDLTRIESPIYPDRRQWARNLAYNQWTLDEFRDGTAWESLQENLDNNRVISNQRKRVRDA